MIRRRTGEAVIVWLKRLSSYWLYTAQLLHDKGGGQ